MTGSPSRALRACKPVGLGAGGVIDSPSMARLPPRLKDSRRQEEVHERNSTRSGTEETRAPATRSRNVEPLPWAQESGSPFLHR
jgi:hypothetical protein